MKNGDVRMQTCTPTHPSQLLAYPLITSHILLAKRQNQISRQPLRQSLAVLPFLYPLGHLAITSVSGRANSPLQLLFQPLEYFKSTTSFASEDISCSLLKCLASSGRYCFRYWLLRLVQIMIPYMQAKAPRHLPVGATSMLGENT